MRATRTATSPDSRATNLAAAAPSDVGQSIVASIAVEMALLVAERNPAGSVRPTSRL